MIKLASTQSRPSPRCRFLQTHFRYATELAFVAFLYLYSTACLAADPIEITAEKHYRFATVSYIFDEPGLHWQDVANKSLKDATPNGNILLDFRKHQLPAWVRVDLDVGAIATEEWLLDVGNTFGGTLRLMVIENGVPVTDLSLDSYESFNTRPYPHRQTIFPITLKPHTSVQLLLQVKNSENRVFHTHLHSKRSFVASDESRVWLLGIHLGIILALMLYHLLLAGATRDKNYLLYGLYIATCVVYSLYNTGFGFQYVWGSVPSLETIYWPIISYAPSLLAILFTVSFLRLNRLAPMVARCYYVVAAIILIQAILRSYDLLSISNSILITSVILYISFIPASIYSMRRGVVYARYYLIAWLLYILALINYILISVGVYLFFPAHASTIQSVAFDLQIILLALALAHRIRVLRDEKTEAEADNRAKSAFLARMSHEIRTPLSGVLGMSDLLSDRLKDKSDIYYNNIIRSSGSSLLTIINDILDYSKFTSGQMELEKIPFSIHRLAVDSLDVFKIKAAEKHIELIANINLDLPQFVEGDPTRVKQVILNFISNAVKFTDQGQIVLSVDFDRQDHKKLRIAVTDTGEGISTKEQQHLFEAFSQANTATARKHGGTGLGLSICKELAQLMDGEIGVESEAGKGSTFWFTALLPASCSIHAVASEDIDLKGLRILIVEDNFTFSELLKTQAQVWGMQPVVAYNGLEGFDKLTAIYERGEAIDLISLDLFMPIMDGLELSRRIQQQEALRDIPRILLTSATNFPPKSQLEAAGISKVIEKPTLPADLFKIYKQILASESNESVNETSSTQAASPRRIPPIQILVVEDNKVNQTVVRGILKRLNQEPVVVDDGEDAVHLITHEKKIFDLVLMDCEMARMDGITATKLIREWETQHKRDATPIVALTAHAIQSQMESCYQAGMSAYLTKPIEVDKLEILLRDYAENHQLDSFSILPLVAGGNGGI